PAPPPAAPEIGTVVAVVIRRRLVIDGRRRLIINLRPFGVDGLVIRTWPHAALRLYAAAHVERTLDGVAGLVLPGDRAPAFAAIARVDQAAARDFRDDLAAGSGRGAQIHGRGDV